MNALSVPPSPVTELRHLLEEIVSQSGPDFSGIGILVSGAPELLPIVALRPSIGWKEAGGIGHTLAAISKLGNEFHDGFHIVSPAFELVRVSQYFAPPIVAGVGADEERRFGARYMSALFGSALPAVLAAGVASNVYGVAVFEDGREVAGA